MDDELKPCPFCGYVDGVEMFELANGYFVVHCNGCGCEVTFNEYKEGTIKAWNRRADNGR